MLNDINEIFEELMKLNFFKKNKSFLLIDIISRTQKTHMQYDKYINPKLYQNVNTFVKYVCKLTLILQTPHFCLDPF